MEKLCAFLFELSNKDRLNILFALKKNPMKLSRVSEKFNFTVPETARNLARLTEAGLIVKDMDGHFRLTPVGEATLQFVPSFEFISKHNEYFKTHTISNLPPEYASSIGVLRGSEFTPSITEILFCAENMLRTAEEFVWISIDQILASSLPLFMDAVTRGVEVRKLMPRNAVIPPNILKLANDPVFERAARMKKLESRYLDKLDVFIFMSEKEIASIGFKSSEGVFPTDGSFRSTDEAALAWTRSLFLYYWGRAKRE